MKVVPIASDSLGVRSMATYVETKDCKIFIDPSAALGPKRYRLPPTEQELETLKKTKYEIAQLAKQCDILTISHYHYDHYDPSETFYQGKKIFAKDIDKNINKSQHKRGSDFKKIVEDSCELIYCDDSKHTVGDTELVFSPPFFHGPENVRLGYVIMVTVDDGEQRILHASDVQGPVTKDAKDYIINQKPDLLIMDGPPTLFLGWLFSKENLQDASDNLIEIMEKLDCEVILDHHLLRDLRYKERFSQPYKSSKKKIQTFAEYLGKENNALEAHRKKLWGK
ncbi:MAG: MBL fold metallo-hydrolase [Candidatus Thermoplasmatota archaeon]|nr:MBL fold metallo-hydrolase [Candidatus Thermoplasmatota archaeon]